MSLSANGRRSTFQRIIAGVCAVGLLFGATACQNDDEEPLIHANHDKGAKLGGTLNDLKSYDEIRAAQERLENGALGKHLSGSLSVMQLTEKHYVS